MKKLTIKISAIDLLTYLQHWTKTTTIRQHDIGLGFGVQGASDLWGSTSYRSLLEELRMTPMINVGIFYAYIRENEQKSQL